MWIIVSLINAKASNDDWWKPLNSGISQAIRNSIFFKLSTWSAKACTTSELSDLLGKKASWLLAAKERFYGLLGIKYGTKVMFEWEMQQSKRYLMIKNHYLALELREKRSEYIGRAWRFHVLWDSHCRTPPIRFVTTAPEAEALNAYKWIRKSQNNTKMLYNKRSICLVSRTPTGFWRTVLRS